MAWTLDDIPDLAGRTAVVTGANGGLGFETARALARRGAHVVMAVRSVEKGEAARAAIVSEIPGASLGLVGLDLASIASVREAGADIAARHRVVDVLVNNAGVMAIPFRRTVDGHEMQLAVNHLGHFALTASLMPALLRSPAGRVVSVTSTGRFLGRTIDPRNPTMDRGYGPWRSYGRAKLAAAQFTVELDRRLAAAGAPIRALAADPGFARTDLQANSAREKPGRSQRFFDASVRRFGSTPAHGALPQIRAATDPRAKGGALYGLALVMRGGPVRVPYLSPFLGQKDRATLWAVSERETGVRFDVEQMVREAMPS